MYPNARTFYSKFGLSEVINASGTLTVLGGNRVRESAAEAMACAAADFVDLDALLGSTGSHIAGLLGVEAALVTAGASPAIMLAVAACIAGTDPYLRGRLPASPPDKREVVVMRCHRNPYDNAVPTAGGTFVEVGDVIKTNPWELEGAIGPDTALSLDETIAVAHAHGVPVIVDAAAELPPKSNLWNLVHRGADLVTFSGGKEIAGPQSSGLLVGNGALVAAARFNGAPFYGAGRPVKAGKENIAGFVVALEEYLAEDEAAHMAEMEAIRDAWISGLSGIDSVETGVFIPTQPGMHPTCIPKAYIRPKSGTPDARELRAALKKGSPSVIVDIWKDTLVLNPQTIRRDEAERVLSAIRDILE
jgi:L-seryl-tRNA(Ser) seleniumtransferase